MSTPRTPVEEAIDEGIENFDFHFVLFVGPTTFVSVDNLGRHLFHYVLNSEWHYCNTSLCCLPDHAQEEILNTIKNT